MRKDAHMDVQELSLKVQMEKNYVNRNAKQARELKESQEKIVALERTLQVYCFALVSMRALCSLHVLNPTSRGAE